MGNHINEEKAMNYKVINNINYSLQEIQTLMQKQDNWRMENTFLNVVITVQHLSVFNCVLLYINLAWVSGGMFVSKKLQNG